MKSLCVTFHLKAIGQYFLWSIVFFFQCKFKKKEDLWLALLGNERSTWMFSRNHNASPSRNPPANPEAAAILRLAYL